MHTNTPEYLPVYTDTAEISLKRPWAVMKNQILTKYQQSIYQKKALFLYTLDPLSSLQQRECTHSLTEHLKSLKCSRTAHFDQNGMINCHLSHVSMLDIISYITIYNIRSRTSR